MNHTTVPLPKELAARLKKYRENANEGYGTNAEVVKVAVRQFLKKHETENGDGNKDQSHLSTNKNNVENKNDERNCKNADK